MGTLIQPTDYRELESIWRARQPNLAAHAAARQSDRKKGLG